MSTQSLLAREWKSLLKDRRLLSILLLLPMGYMLLFGFLYGQDKVRHIPIVYLDEDRSMLSGQILQAIAASETFELIGSVDSEKTLLEKVQSGQAYAGFILPAQLSKHVLQNKQGEVMALIDGSNLIIANRALSSFHEIVQTVSQGISIKRLEAKGVSPEQGSGIHMGYRLLYNPGNSYSVYLLIGLLGTVLQSVTMLGMTLSLAREKEEGTQQAFCKKPWNYFGTKAIPYFLLGMWNVLVSVGVLTVMFHIPFLGTMVLFIGLALAFVCSLLGLSFVVALFSQTKVQATQITMLLIYPSFFLSGFTWPFAAMPTWVSVIGHLLPVTYFLHGIREVALKGNGWTQVSPDVLALLVFAFITTTVALAAYSWSGWGHRGREEAPNEGV